MRLKTTEIATFIEIFSAELGKQEGALYLYGSRTNDRLRGGDIDLLLIVKEENTKEKLLSDKAAILSALKRHLGERRIDLTIANVKDMKVDPFLSEIMESALLLKRWD